MCDTLAKQAVHGSLDPRANDIKQQVLPRESLAVFVGGVKQTSVVANEVRDVLGHTEATIFYTTPLG